MPKDIARETFAESQRIAAEAKSIEIMNVTEEYGVDEVVANNVRQVHIEQMDDKYYSIIITTETEQICLGIGSNTDRAKVSMYAHWLENRHIVTKPG